MSYIQEFRKGLELCLSNYDLWINESKELYDKGSYGHAYALIFNGAEALVQAWYCWCVLCGINKPEDSEIKKAFKDHDFKLSVIYGFILGHVNYQYYINHIQNQTHIKKKLEDIEAELKIISDAMGRFRKDKMFQRNKGLYVEYDQVNIRFHSPSEIKREEVDYFLAELSIANNIIKGIINNTSPELVEILRKYAYTLNRVVEE